MENQPSPRSKRTFISLLAPDTHNGYGPRIERKDSAPSMLKPERREPNIKRVKPVAQITFVMGTSGIGIMFCQDYSRLERERRCLIKKLAQNGHTGSALRALVEQLQIQRVNDARATCDKMQGFVSFTHLVVDNTIRYALAVPKQALEYVTQKASAGIWTNETEEFDECERLFDKDEVIKTLAFDEAQKKGYRVSAQRPAPHIEKPSYDSCAPDEAPIVDDDGCAFWKMRSISEHKDAQLQSREINELLTSERARLFLSDPAVNGFDANRFQARKAGLSKRSFNDKARHIVVTEFEISTGKSYDGEVRCLTDAIEDAQCELAWLTPMLTQFAKVPTSGALLDAKIEAQKAIIEKSQAELTALKSLVTEKYRELLEAHQRETQPAQNRERVARHRLRIVQNETPEEKKIRLRKEADKKAEQRRRKREEGMSIGEQLVSLQMAA